MARSTYRTYLMHASGTGGTAGTYSKLIDIKETPDLGGEPEQLQSTTLSDSMHTYEPGIQNLTSLRFTANYTISDYETLKALEGKDDFYAVWFGGTGDGPSSVPTGDAGKFWFKGKLIVYPAGGGVNSIVDMVITISPSTPITFDGTI